MDGGYRLFHSPSRSRALSLHPIRVETAVRRAQGEPAQAGDPERATTKRPCRALPKAKGRIRGLWLLLHAL